MALGETSSVMSSASEGPGTAPRLENLLAGTRSLGVKRMKHQISFNHD